MAEQEPSKPARDLAAQIERDGGRVLALYQEPVGDHWQIFCLLPRAKCEASPYQRDLSPTHVKRLTESIKRLDRFVDPIVAISPRPGVYWTPNGNHRRTVLDKLKAEFVPAIVVVEPEMLFEVLPLNVEKAHNLKEKSLEVIRMYRALVKDEPDTTEEKWTFQFESPHFITLGADYARAFDGVWEYTCFCAIEPRRRPEYVRTMAEIVKPGGWLLACFFPMRRRGAGPPFPVAEREVRRLFAPAFRIERSYAPRSVRARQGQEWAVLFHRVNAPA